MFNGIKDAIDDVKLYDLGCEFYKKNQKDKIALKNFPHSLFRVFCDDEVWFKLPKSVTEPYGLFYRDPIMYTWSSKGFLFDQSKLDKYLKKNYPIQFFLTDTLPTWFRRKITYKIKNALENLDYFFNPRNDSIRKSIPKHWCDCTELIPTLIGACIIRFVEEEDGLVVRNWGESQWEGETKAQFNQRRREQRKVKKIIETAYEYFKVERPRLQTDLLEIDKAKEEKILVDIIKIKHYLWT